ncbi:YgiQ family radical SAM protein [Lentisphaerota bacterium ZTH]|nr:YgiQ family radical SAM protein [Lentisphaerota bacterium]WET05566.1 YgiQ family radical SAM protein [Lentisphaerota bacterium ZTH]
MKHKDIPFLPTSRAEMQKYGWDELDILLVTGDCYVDHPSFGIAVIGRVLLNKGYRVGIIAQPDWKDPAALQVMGRPVICCGVTAGNMDSMVNIYTAARRLRRSDAYSENGETGKRPPHAVVVYTQLAKRAFPGLPVFIGGIEASLRRVAHYDYWQDKMRQSVIVDAKADVLSFGMGERSVVEIVRMLEINKPLRGIRGTACLLGKKEAERFNPEKYIELPSWEEMKSDRDALMRSTVIIEREMNPMNGRGLFQRYGDRLLVLEPPAQPLDTDELDRVHDLGFSCLPHPEYKKSIPAFETIKHSVPAVRGCPGGCAFCGLVSHQGRGVRSRSQESIIREIKRMVKRSNFRGTVSDIGGAAGNILYNSPRDIEKCRNCKRISCLFPKACSNYDANGKPLIGLLRKIRAIPEVKHLYLNSGIRLDLAVRQKELMQEIIRHHVSGHMKVAPEHLHPNVLKLMRKNPAEDFYKFKDFFEETSGDAGKEQYLIPLFISNFPGCTAKDMKTVDDYLNDHNWSPQQVQDYIPLPMTMGAAMYYTGKTADGTPIKVNRGLAERRPQMNVLKKKRSTSSSGKYHAESNKRSRSSRHSRGRNSGKRSL